MELSELKALVAKAHEQDGQPDMFSGEPLDAAKLEQELCLAYARQQKARRVESNRMRQRTWASKQRDAGLVQVHGWVHSHQAADVKVALQKLADNSDLELRVLRHTPTGKLASLR